MGNLNLSTLSAREVKVLGNYLLGINFSSMSTTDVIVVLTGRCSSKSIQDAIRVLRSRGQISKDQAQDNAKALGEDSPCKLLAESEIGSGGKRSCKLQSGHDGPCVPNDWLMTQALAQAKMIAKADAQTIEANLKNWADLPKVLDSEVVANPFDTAKDNSEKIVQKFDNNFLRTTIEKFEKLKQDILAEQKDTRKDLESLQNLVHNLQVQGVAAGGSITQVVEVHLPELPKAIALKRRPHAAFAKVFALTRAGLNVMLIGPAGSGKTTIASDVAEAFQRSFTLQSLTAGTPESALLGRLLPLGQGGSMRYVSSPFICAFQGERVVQDEDGKVSCVLDEDAAGVIHLDEIDAADANMLLAVNSALANGVLFVEQRASSGLAVEVKRHRNCVILSAANTFGTGMDLQYAGRNALDAAFLDRWYPVFINYDPVLEASIAGLPAPDVPQWQPVPAPSNAEWADLARWVLGVREKAEKAGLRKIMGTRALLKARAARFAGVPTNEIKRDLLLGWPPDHIAKVQA